MAFDQNTRNRLQKFVSSARKILAEEFVRQLQSVYGMDPKQGALASTSSLKHLDDQQRQIAHQLRETFEHYLANTPGKGDKDRAKQVLDRIVREQAFTVLNRLSALRMAEARGFLIESIANGQNSEGFQLYKYACETALGETGDAYRQYLFALFDEFALDLAVLFDRNSSQGRLFPRDAALQDLLNEINHPEIEPLWAEDETIGWIYQYFNSQEERKKMRAESQAPRNSRELAVRNQFFTPRYVVEFLTDNTLGRIWYEMTKGNTALVDSCRYLVRRPTEIFLKPGETSPEVEGSSTEALCQEELLKQPVYVPHRPLKDPRSIRMLDPACGSMHFGLYAFDLFERIYLEAWQLEQQLGPDTFTREANQQALQHTFESLEAFKQQIPKLIIEHNIHGVDIDPRAVQIAGLSLWQRAQRAWHQQGIKPQQRPSIVKSNIVCAEPMPGEKALLQEFTIELNPPVLGQLLDVIFDKMQLAGEAGTLLKIEEEIQTAIHDAREQWLKQSGRNSVGDMFQAEKDAATPQAKSGFDLRGIDDETFWDAAEQRILQALSDYADQAESNADQKRLFAEDAAKGFAFIELCRKRFDVVKMNPPFGEYSEKFKASAKKTYRSGGHDIITAFIERGVMLLRSEGILGSITSRTPFFAPTTADWRENAVLQKQVDIWADLGEGVLDDAMVETCAYTLFNSAPFKSTLFIESRDALETIRKSQNIDTVDSSLTYAHQKSFNTLKGSPFAYWVRPSLLEVIRDNPPLAEKDIHVKVGLQTGDDFRFIRSWWETPINSSNEWLEHAKGGENQPFLTDVFLKVNWKDSGAQIKSTSSCRLNAYTNVDPNEVTKTALTFPYRTHRFSPAIIRPKVVTGVAGMGITSTGLDIEALLAFLNSSIVNELIKTRLSRKELAPLYQAGTISPTPLPDISEENEKKLAALSEAIRSKLQYYFSFDETTTEYASIFDVMSKLNVYNADQIQKLWRQYRKEITSTFKEIDLVVAELFDIKPEEALLIHEENSQDFELVIPQHLLGDDELRLKLISHQLGKAFGRWEAKEHQSSKKSVFLPEQITEFLPYHKGDNFKGLNEQLRSVTKDFFERTNGFFTSHLKQYSKGRRQAPIYWPLQTPSGSYTLWVYYHRLNEQTLYTCVNDFVEPRLEQVEQDLNGFRSKSARSSQEEKELEKLSDLTSELRDFRDELLHLAKFWKPNLNDGVQITAAPLWKLFQHKAWQKKLKQTWENLEKGDYDWAHLAFSIWPERVLRKCHQDRSLAIAHDVENHFWQEIEVPIIRRGRDTGDAKLEWHPKALSEAELSSAIHGVIKERGL